MRGRRVRPRHGRRRRRAAGATPASARYLDLGPAPGFEGGGRWLEHAREPLEWRELRGRVVLVDFWTYTCINCIRTLPYLRAWDRRYRDRGLTVVGVHTPEFPFERETANVRSAIAQNGSAIRSSRTTATSIWNAFGNQYWPAKYLIDARGRVRYTHFGEGDSKAHRDGHPSAARRGAATRAWVPVPAAPAQSHRAGAQTPETYFGAKRAQGWLVPPAPGTRDYPRAAGPPLNGFALGGRWKVTGESATAVRDATVTARFRARRVYLVLRSADRRRVACACAWTAARPARSRSAATTLHGGRPAARGRARPAAGLRTRA